MSTKIISVKQAARLGGKLVLAGGCFDVLHPGHIVFLQKAKKEGNFLLVLLESDEKIRKLKGMGRPVHTQKERAKILSALEVVDFIVCLPWLKTDLEYDKLVQKIKPDIIAATKGDETIEHKKRVALKTGAKLIFVTRKIGQYSTTKILIR